MMKTGMLQARERLRREKAAAEGNYPGDEEDEEAQVQRAMDLSRAEAEFRRGVEQRGGSYERGGGIHCIYKCTHISNYEY